MTTFFDQSTMQLVNSFQTLVTALENENKVLKNVSAIKDVVSQNSSSADTLAMINSLVAIESTISKMEQNFSIFDESVRVEAECIREGKELIKQAKDQAAMISAFESSLPIFLKEEVAITSSAPSVCVNDENVFNSNINGGKEGNRRKSIMKQSVSAPLASSETPKQQLGLVVDASQFDRVATVTKGRISLAQVNESLLIIKKLIASKQKVIRQFSKAGSSSTPKKANKAHSSMYEEYKKLLKNEHDSSVFISEGELRAARFFEGGDSSGKSIIAILRSLARIKMIRSGNENTYILL